MLSVAIVGLGFHRSTADEAQRYQGPSLPTNFERRAVPELRRERGHLFATAPTHRSDKSEWSGYTQRTARIQGVNSLGDAMLEIKKHARTGSSEATSKATIPPKETPPKKSGGSRANSAACRAA
jgi:hypothetical protein